MLSASANIYLLFSDSFQLYIETRIDIRKFMSICTELLTQLQY